VLPVDSLLAPGRRVCQRVERATDDRPMSVYYAFFKPFLCLLVLLGRKIHVLSVEVWRRNNEGENNLVINYFFLYIYIYFYFMAFFVTLRRIVYRDRPTIDQLVT